MSEEQAPEQDNATVADQSVEESPPVENTAPEQEVASTVDQRSILPSSLRFGMLFRSP